MRQFNQQVIESLEMMALGLPDKDLQPGETWPFETVYTIYTVTGAARNTQNALFRMTCKYTGTRVRDGREEAVIELTGQVVRGSDTPNNSGGENAGSGDAPSGGERGPGRGPPGGGSENTTDEANQRRGVTGLAVGAAAVDVATGQVVLGRIVSDMAVLYPLTLRQNPPAGAPPQQQPREMTVTVHAGLKTDVTLRRSLTKAEPKPLYASPGDYGSIVRAQCRRRRNRAQPGIIGEARKTRSQAFGGGDAPANHQRFSVRVFAT